MKATVAYKVVALALIALLVTPYIAVATEQSPQSSPAVRGEKAVDTLAAKLYINKIKLFINITLRVANSHNITIPENLTTNINESKALLGEAEEELASGNTTRAVNLATQAADKFAPVALYVWSHIPAGEKKDLAEKGLIQVIESRIRGLDRIREYIQKLNESGVNVKPLIVILDKINKTLNTALAKAKAGDLRGAKNLLQVANHLLMVEFRGALHGVNKKLHQVAACAAALRGLGIALYRIEHKLNFTINLIQENKTDQARMQLVGVENGLTGLSTALQRIYNISEKRNPNSTTTQVLGILLNATVEAKEYINESIQSLDANDANTSIMYITIAIQTIDDALGQVNETNLPRIIHHKIAMLRHEAEKARKMIIHGKAKIYSAMAMHVDKTEAWLKHLLNEYENGKITKMRLVKSFTHAYIMLERMKHAAGPNAPDWLIKKIDDTLQWIKNNVPEAGSIHGGGHTGHGGHGGSREGHGNRP